MTYDNSQKSHAAPALSVVIPLFNEAESLQELHREICEACRQVEGGFEIVFVDDGSTDNSFAILETIFRSDNRVKVIQFRRNCGKSEALAAGFAESRGRMVVTMDADLQDDPAEIPNLIKKLEAGFDVISGWKKRRRDPISKRFPSRVWNRCTALLTGVNIHDFNCGLKMYRREVIETVHVYGELHRYIPALASREGYRIAEIPVNHRPRKHGRTKYGFSRFGKGMLDLVTVLFLGKYNQRPLHLFGVMGFVSASLGAVITLYLVILRVFRAVYLTNRPLLVIGLLLLIVGVQFISIGLLGEMITRSNASARRYAIRKTLGV